MTSNTTPADTTINPTVIATPDKALLDGQRITVKVTGFGVGGKVWLSECASAADVTDRGCGLELPEQTFLVTGNDRDGSGAIVVHDRASTTHDRASINTPDPNALRCISACVLVATAGSGGYAHTPIRFGRG